MIIEAKKIHAGQYKPYGDSYDVWEVKSSEDKPTTEAWCVEELLKGKPLPDEQTFLHKWRNNEMEYSDYFRGYVKFESISDGEYRFTHVMPFTD